MKDGRTHLAHKAEHAVDLETGALLALTVQGGRSGRHDHRVRDDYRGRGASGAASGGNNKRCTATGDGCAGSGANGCHGYAASGWNAVLLTYMRPAGCGGRTCEATRIS